MTSQHQPNSDGGPEATTKGRRTDMSEQQLHVFVNRRKVNLDRAEMTVAELVTTAGFQGQGWDVLRLQGEGDSTGGTPLTASDPLVLKNGDRFRVIPGNRTFGS